MLIATVKPHKFGYEGAVESYVGAERRFNGANNCGTVRTTKEEALEDAEMLLRDLRNDKR
jgi:hypothetical protein